MELDDLFWNRRQRVSSSPGGWIERRGGAQRGTEDMEPRAWSWPRARETCTFTDWLYVIMAILSFPSRKSGLQARAVDQGQQ